MKHVKHVKNVKTVKPLKAAGVWMALLLTLPTLQLFTPRAQAQTGAYVVPRITTLYIGTLTNNQSLTNVFVGTNFLNYSGFHRVGLWATVTCTNVATFNGTATVNVDFSPGPGSGYTNSLLGTNVIYSTGSPVSWTIPLGGQNPLVAFTNLDWPWADSTVLFKGTKISSTATNNQSIQLEIDAVVTP
jgi:hypothetical protein